MQVGDLVTLSSAGCKLGMNWAYKDDIGIIVQIKSNVENPYQIRWMQSTWRKGLYWFKRYEIKKAKPIS